MSISDNSKIAFIAGNYCAPAAGAEERLKKLDDDKKSWAYHSWTEFGMTDTYDPAKEQQKYQLVQLKEKLQYGITEKEGRIRELESGRDRMSFERDQIKMRLDSDRWNLSMMEDKQRNVDTALYRVKEKLRNPEIKGDRRMGLEERRQHLQDELYRLNDSIYNKKDQIRNMEYQCSDLEQKRDEASRNLDYARTELYQLKDRLYAVNQQMQNLGFA